MHSHFLLAGLDRAALSPCRSVHGCGGEQGRRWSIDGRAWKNRDEQREPAARLAQVRCAHPPRLSHPPICGSTAGFPATGRCEGASGAGHRGHGAIGCDALSLRCAARSGRVGGSSRRRPSAAACVPAAAKVAQAVLWTGHGFLSIAEIFTAIIGPLQELGTIGGYIGLR